MKRNEHRYNKYWLKFLSSILMVLVISGGIINFKVKADEYVKGYTTVYVTKPDAITYSGSKVRQGICAASKSYLGKTIILYQRLPDDTVGNILGIYECLDTGKGSKAFQEGKVIDVWKPNKESKDEFIDLTYMNNCQGRVWIRILN